METLLCYMIHVLLLPAFVVLLQNKHTTLAENGETLISAQPRIKRPPSRSKNLISAQGG